MPFTTVAETFLAGKDSTFTLGTTVIPEFMSGSYTLEVSEDDMTNGSAAGDYFSVRTIRKASGDFQLAFKNGVTPLINVGTMYALIYASAGSGEYLSCNARIISKSVPQLDVKAGIKQSYKWTSQGAITVVAP